MRDSTPEPPREGEEPFLNEPADRLLDHMLERCLGGEQDDSSLVERVVSALQRGESGSLEAEELEALRTPEHSFGGADPEVGAPAPAEDAVDPLQRGVLRPLPATDREAPPLVRSNGEATNGHAHRFHDRMAPGAARETRENGSLALEGGASSADRPVLLRRAAAAVVLFAGTLGVWYGLDGGPGGAPGPLEQADEPAGPPAIAGLERPGPEPPGPVVPEVPPESEVNKRFDELNARLFAPAKNPFVWGVPGYGSRRPAMQELSQLMEDEPRLWERFEDELGEMLAKSQEPLERLRLDPNMEERAFRFRVVPLALDFLIQDDSAASLALAIHLWDEYPEHFDHVHQIAFAERGADDFLRECNDLVEIYDPGYDEPPYYPAAYLAFRDDTMGREILTDLLTQDDPELLDARLLSALALDHLEDSNAWSWMRERCRRTIEEYLESDMRAAVQAVLLVEYYSSVRERGETSVARISIQLIDHLLRRTQEVGTEEDVRKLMATLF